MSHGTFGTAINCIDGRAQKPIADWVKKNAVVEYVDVVTEPGCDGVIHAADGAKITELKRKVLISANAHGSSIVAIAGHYDCAGNPVSEEEHKKQIKEAVETVRTWEGIPAKVVGLWVNSAWEVEEVA